MDSYGLPMLNLTLDPVPLLFAVLFSAAEIVEKISSMSGVFLFYLHFSVQIIGFMMVKRTEQSTRGCLFGFLTMVFNLLQHFVTR